MLRELKAKYSCDIIALTLSSEGSMAFDGDRLLLTYYVGEDHALVGGARETRLSLKFRTIDLPELLQKSRPS
jgi:hypothetical protein